MRRIGPAHGERDGAAVVASVIAAAQWRRRLLTREIRGLPSDAPMEQRVLVECCQQTLAAIADGFELPAGSAVVLTPDRREVHMLLARMRATDDAVRRAHAAGVSWVTIQGVTQRAWPLACALFEAIGWAEAFGAQIELPASVYEVRSRVPRPGPVVETLSRSARVVGLRRRLRA
jgi:hypothetical protein